MLIKRLRKSSSDITFWIVIFFLVRLFGITNPPLEKSHNWRQSTVAMVARNFVEVDANIFYPRIDIAGDRSGITGMEFPVFNYLIYLLSKVFGYDHWYGRLINLFVTSIGLVFFYRLLGRRFDERIAFYSTWVLLFSIWFSFSRKIMPDTFSMSLMIVGLYYLDSFLLTDRFQTAPLIVTFFLIALATLSKIPSAYILILVIPILFDKSIRQGRKLGVLLAVSVVGILAMAWYFLWVPHLNNTYGFEHFFMGKNLSLGSSEILDQAGEVLSMFYEKAIKYVAFALFLLGLYRIVTNRQNVLKTVFLFGLCGFILFMFSAGESFVKHDYYIIPFVPLMSLVAGYGLASISSRRLVMIFLLSIAVEGVLNQYHDVLIDEKSLLLLELEEDLNAFSDRDDLVLINSGEYPTPMYFASRKGWILTNDEIVEDEIFTELQKRGLKYVVILRQVFGSDLELDLPVVLDKEVYVIYASSY